MLQTKNDNLIKIFLFGCNMDPGACVKEAVEPIKTNTMLEEILIPFIVFAASFGIVYVVITARNRERLSLIEKGINPLEFKNKSDSSSYAILKWALLLVGIGLGLFLGSIMDTYTQLPSEPAYFAGALLFGGLGLALAFMIAKKGEKNKQA